MIRILLARSLIRAVNRIVRHPELRRDIDHGVGAWSVGVDAEEAAALRPALSVRTAEDRACAPPIFVSARFRTGSTALWRAFRLHPEVRAFYEPLNERRWFDPTGRGTRVDRSHRGVADYWKEYEHLEHLGAHFREDWTTRRLHLRPSEFEPKLDAYLRKLVEAAPRRAVLQFNRLDFRLPWIRRCFPRAVVIHLYRDARDQWVSTLFGQQAEVAHDLRLVDFEPYDHFYLLAWIRDLEGAFPFLARVWDLHPYVGFYAIWRLSRLFGESFSDLSVSYETLTADPVGTMSRVLEVCRLDTAHAARCAEALEGGGGGGGARYASAGWYAEQEARADALVDEFLAGLIRSAGRCAPSAGRALD